METTGGRRSGKRWRRRRRVAAKPSGSKEEEEEDGIDSKNQLEEWFLFEILCKLPMKAVHQFKCVSKQCLSFISHPSFFEIYLSRGPSSSSPCPLVFLSPRLHLVEENPKPFPPLPPLVRKLPQFHMFSLSNPPPICIGIGRGGGSVILKIKATHKGFLLLGRDVTRGGGRKNYRTVEFLICKAMTNQCFAVPNTPRAFRKEFRFNFVARVETTGGGGGGGVLTSYRIVAIHSPPEARNIFTVHLFTSETGRWTKLQVSCDSAFSLFDRRPVTVNNALHWMYPMIGSLTRNIYIYQPYINPHKFSIIEIPAESREEIEDVLNGSAECGVSQGRLMYYKVMGSCLRDALSLTLCIWQLQQDNQWCLQHAMRIADHLLSYFDYFSFKYSVMMGLVAFHPYDPDVLYLFFLNQQVLVSFNFRTKEVEQEEDVQKFDPYCVPGRLPYLSLPFLLPY